MKQNALYCDVCPADMEFPVGAREGQRVTCPECGTEQILVPVMDMDISVRRLFKTGRLALKVQETQHETHQATTHQANE